MALCVESYLERGGEGEALEARLNSFFTFGTGEKSHASEIDL